MSTSWSYSAYSSAVQCLQKYKLCYIDKITPTAPESGDLAFGSALHSAINSVLNGDDGEITFEIYWNSYQGKELAFGRFKYDELKELGLNFISKFKRLHAPKYKLIFAEERLYGEYKGVRLEGTLDFYGEYNGSRSLRDFKTSGYNYQREKAQVALQLSLYTYLAITNGKQAPETLGYTVFNKGVGSIQDLTWEFSEEEMYEHLDNLVEYCKTIDEQKHFAKNPNACLYPTKCQYFDNCWKEKK